MSRVVGPSFTVASRAVCKSVHVGSLQASLPAIMRPLATSYDRHSAILVQQNRLLQQQVIMLQRQLATRPAAPMPAMQAQHKVPIARPAPYPVPYAQPVLQAQPARTVPPPQPGAQAQGLPCVVLTTLFSVPETKSAAQAYLAYHYGVSHLLHRRGYFERGDELSGARPPVRLVEFDYGMNSLNFPQCASMKRQSGIRILISFLSSVSRPVLA